VKVAFDIGGLVSRHPALMCDMMRALAAGGVDVYVLTDMNPRDAYTACRDNAVPVRPDRILSANWAEHGDLCKTKLVELHGIDVLVDDRPDYCASGDFVGLVLSPRPEVPYNHPDWVNRTSQTVCVPPEHYEEFLEWQRQKSL
jgi:hypothetical protein